MKRERGETLIELLIAVSILGIAIVTIVGAMAVAVRASDVHKKQVRVQLTLRNYAEKLSDPSVPYRELCGIWGDPTYDYDTLMTGYYVWIERCECLQGDLGATYDDQCLGDDKGAQLLTLRAQGPDGETRTLGLVKRAP